MKSMEENLQDGLNYLIPLRWLTFMIDLGGDSWTKSIPRQQT